MATIPNGVDPTARSIKPDGLPLAIVVLSSIFLGLSVIVVSLRTYIRLVKRTFGTDDGFMVAGCVSYIATSGLAIYAATIGLGRRDANLNAWQQSRAMEYYIIWILNYVVSLATVKSSICITITRIASMKINLRYTVYALLTVTWASFLITFIGTLTYCQPVSAIWTPQLILSGQGTCAPVTTFIIIAHTATVSTILTDLALVVVPAIMLWNTQMKLQFKIQAFGLLSFASVASIITMVRIPYVNKFEGGTDLPFWVAHIMLCSNVETGIGCIASSLPALRHYFRGAGEGSSSGGPSAMRQSNANLKSGTQQRGRKMGRMEDWEALDDAASDQSATPIHPYGITKTYDIEMSSMEKTDRDD